MLALSMSTVRRHVDENILPSVQIGKRRLVRVSDLVAFAEQGISLDRLQKVRAALSGESSE